MLSAMKLIIFCLTRYVMPLIAVVSDSLASQCLGWHWGGEQFSVSMGGSHVFAVLCSGFTFSCLLLCSKDSKSRGAPI